MIHLLQLTCFYRPWAALSLLSFFVRIYYLYLHRLFRGQSTPVLVFFVDADAD